jgi:hypothetical protein
MKQLLWLVSISCSLLAMLILPSQASEFDLSHDLNLAEFHEMFPAAVAKLTPEQPADVNDLELNLPTTANKSLAVWPLVDRSTKEPVDILASDRPLQPIDLETPAIESNERSEPTPARVGASSKIDTLASNYQLLPESEPPLEKDTLASNDQVQILEPPPPGSNHLKVSPGLSISNPIGFGADSNIAFAAASYQSRTRGGNVRDGEFGFGVGIGDAINSVGAEISYTVNSFGSSNAFGSGGFNIKLHKRLSDNTAVAVGWNRFANILISNGRIPGNTGFPSVILFAPKIVRIIYLAALLFRQGSAADNFSHLVLLRLT